MKDLNFPIFKTKIDELNKTFNLEDPNSRKKYFMAKAGKEIKNIRNYLKKNKFVGILLGKKSSGKGTYSKLLIEAVGNKYVKHLSVGDVVRQAHKDLGNKTRKAKLRKYLESNYRGFITIDRAFDIISGRDTTTLLPTEITMALLRREAEKIKHKALFIDGFPRNLDQISYSLFLQSIIGHGSNLDFLVFIDVPEKIIDERMKSRVVCPKCQTPRGLKLLRTKKIGYDNKSGLYYLICDNLKCKDSRMITKEGDDKGIESIRKRINTDHIVMEKLLSLEGMPKVYLRNSVPTKTASEYVDEYEITPMFEYERDNKGNIKVSEKSWTVKTKKGEKSYSLLPAPVTVSFIKQISNILDSQ